MQIRGIKHGNTIQLLQDLDIPDGDEICLEIVPKTQHTPEQHQQQLQALFGILEHQPDLDHTFDTIDRDRHQYQGREINSLD
jgi:hypothetical protein